MLSNLVEEAANNPGTAINVNLLGAPTNRRGFVQAFGNGGQAAYALTDNTQTEWGIGTVQAGSPNVLARTTVLGNTAGTTARLNFTGACRVYNEVPAERQVVLDATGKLPASAIPLKLSTASGVWGTPFDLNVAETDIVTLPIPNGTRVLWGGVSIRANNLDVPTVMTGPVLIRQGAAELTRSDAAVAAAGGAAQFCNAVGSFAFSNPAGGGWVGCSLVFRAKKVDAVGPFNLISLHCSATFAAG
jgi:hypothetical protein